MSLNFYDGNVMRKRKFHSIISRGILLFLAFSLLFTTSCGKTNNASTELVVRCLDVGEGGATLIRTPVGDILIDAGTNEGEELLCLHLANLGVSRLLLAVFTHSDEDHIGGADGVLRRFPTERVWITSFFEDSENTKRLADAARDTDAEIESVLAGKQLAFGDAVLTVLSPYGAMSWRDSNDVGIVFKLVFGKTSALFMGDASTRTEQFLLDVYEQTQLDCDILIVGHHGAASSSGEVFLAAVTPQYAAISCGENNLYGHPHGAALARLEAVGARILRTDVLGDIVLQTDGERVIYDDKKD